MEQSVEEEKIREVDFGDVIKPFEGLDTQNLPQQGLQSHSFFLISFGVIIFNIIAKQPDNIDSETFGLNDPKEVSIDVHTSPTDPDTKRYSLPRSLGIGIVSGNVTRWAIPEYDKKRNALIYEEFSTQTPREAQTLKPDYTTGEPNPLIVSQDEIPNLEIKFASLENVSGKKAA